MAKHRRFIAHTLREAEELAALDEPDRISFAALLVTQGKYRFYTLTMPSDVLKETCTIDLAVEKPLIGFQRRLDERRAKEIANYIDSGLGTIPGSIVLSAQPEAELMYMRRPRTLSFKKHPRAFLILDGQHRVFGFHLAKSPLRVPVVIYNNLRKSDEVSLFMDINTKQRPVPNELILQIKSLAKTETDEEEFLRHIFDNFDKRLDSPLFGLMSPAEKRKGKISRVTFNASIKAIMTAFSESDAEYTYNVLQSYLHAWMSELRSIGTTGAISNPTLFRAIMLLFPVAAARISDRFGDEYTADNFSDVLQPLFVRLKKSDVQKPSGSHLSLSIMFKKRLESGFALGRGRLR